MKYVITSLLTFILLISPISAEEYTFRLSDMDENAVKNGWDKLVQSLPEDIAAEAESLNPADPDLTGKTDISYWWDKLKAQIAEAFTSWLPDLSALLGFILVMAIVKHITLFSSETADACVSFIRLTLAIFVYRSTAGIITVAQTYMTRITALLSTLTPVMQTVYIAEGRIGEAEVSASGVMLAVTVIGYVNTYLIAPFTSVLFTLAVVSNVCNEVNITGLTEGVRRFVMRLWQICTICFTFMLGTQTVIARSADNLASRTARFALGSLVPVAGSVIAEAFNTVKEGMGFLRTATGVGGIIVIILILLPGIIPLAVYKLGITVSAMLSDTLKLDGTSALFNEVKGIVELVSALVLYTSLMLIFGLILFTKTYT